jgi:serine/threonine protein phosphatase PrpC
MLRALEKGLNDAKQDLILPAGEWIELIDHVVQGTDAYWNAKSWGKKAPDGVQKVTEYLAIYRGEKKPSVDIQSELKGRVLAHNPAVFKELIAELLNKKVVVPQTSFFSKSKTAKVSYSEWGRTKSTIRFYEALEKLISPNGIVQQQGKTDMLALRDKVWAKIGLEKMTPVEQEFFNKLNQLLDAFVNHLSAGSVMPQMVFSELKAQGTDKQIKLTEGCKRKFNLIKDKGQSILELIKKLDSENLRDRYSDWFSPLNSALATCTSGDYFNHYAYAFLRMEDIARFNKFSKDINSWLHAKEDAKGLSVKQLDVELNENTIKNNLARAKLQLQIEDQIKLLEPVVKSNVKDAKLDMVFESKIFGKTEVVAASAQGRRPQQEDSFVIDSVSGLNQLQHPESDIPALLGHALLNVADQLKSEKSGAAYAVSLVHGEKIYTAWVGDARAYLIQGDKVEHLTWDHNPENEKERVLAKAGIEMFPRINGQHIYYAPGKALAVTRMVGNVDMNNNPYSGIICTPSFSVMPFQGGKPVHLILSSDGVRDAAYNNATLEPVMPRSSHVTAAVMKDVVGASSSCKQAAGEIVEKAYRRNSYDNVTVVCAALSSIDKASDNGVMLAVIDGRDGRAAALKIKDILKGAIQQAIINHKMVAKLVIADEKVESQMRMKR